MVLFLKSSSQIPPKIQTQTQMSFFGSVRQARGFKSPVLENTTILLDRLFHFLSLLMEKRKEKVGIVSVPYFMHSLSFFAE